jgi:hypothetical protein
MMNNKSKKYAKKILFLAIPAVLCGVGLQIWPSADLKVANAEDVEVANIDHDIDDIVGSSKPRRYTDDRPSPKPSPRPSPQPSPRPKPRK